MHIESDRALIDSHIPSVRYLTVTVAAPPRTQPARERAPVQVSLVLDRSGSMAGRKIAMAREAVAHAIQLLDSRDRLAVVVYDDQVDTLLTAAAATKETRNAALNALKKIDARGSTDLAGGWFRGVEQIQPAAAAAGESSPTADVVRRVLLLTDGLANVGITDHGELRDAAVTFREKGIATSTFGVGADFDEELLASIATHGGGHFYFIENARQIPDFLASELGETLEVVARDAVFDITCGPGVTAMLLNDLPVESSEGRLRVRLGDLVADQEVTFAVAVTCARRAAGQTAFVDCRVTDRRAALFQQPMRVEWRAADAAANEQQPVNQAVLVVVANVLADRARSLALAANRRRDFEEARRILRNRLELLRRLAPGNAQVDSVIDALRQLEGRVTADMDPLSRKAEHYLAYSRTSSRDKSGKSKRRTE